MKMMTILAAGAVALTGLAPLAPAAAQHRTVVTERTVVRHDGPGYRHRPHRARQVCRWQVRHHHRVRVCRSVDR